MHVEDRPLSALACVCIHLRGAGTPASYCAGASPAPRADANKTRLHYYKLYEEINRRYRGARPLPLGLFLLCSESHDPLGCWQRTPMSSCKRPGVNKERQCTAQCSAVQCCAEQSRAEQSVPGGGRAGLTRGRLGQSQDQSAGLDGQIKVGEILRQCTRVTPWILTQRCCLRATPGYRSKLLFF